MTKILVVDDEESNRYSIGWILKAGGYEIEEVSSGREALDYLEVNRPSLIVLDVRLPDINGFEVCRRIREKPETKAIPILNISACFQSSADRTLGLEQGADGYLIHPVEGPELLATVKTLLRARESEKSAVMAANLWRTTFDAIDDAVCVIDSQGLIRKANRTLLDLVGEESVEGQALSAILPFPLVMDRFLESVGEAGGFRSEFEMLDRIWNFCVNSLDGMTIENSGFVCILRDITEERRAQEGLQKSEARYRQLAEELQEAKVIADRANQHKSMFLANMSHEIRTPLGAILGFAELLKEADIEAKEKEEFVDIIISNGRNLATLIDDILDLSKVEAGKMLLDYSAVNVWEILEEVFHSLEINARSKGLSLKLDWDPNVPRYFMADGNRLRQIFMNLIGNAVKFTDKGGVSVRVTMPGSTLAIVIEDSGRGISESDQKQLFQPFSQGDNSTTRKYGGTGLGLALSKKLVQALGGDILLVHSELNRGSEFLVTLRLEIARTSNEGKGRGRGKRNGKAKAEGAFAGSLNGLSILVADDSADNRLLVRRILSNAGANVFEVENGSEALKAVAIRDFDLILMDIQMPEVDGYEAIGRLRKRGYKKPILALTAHAMQDERKRCLDLGFSQYLTKPIDRSELLNSLIELGNDARGERSRLH